MSPHCIHVSKVVRIHIILYAITSSVSHKNIQSEKYSQAGDLLFIRFSVYGETCPRNVHIVGFHIHPFAILF